MERGTAFSCNIIQSTLGLDSIRIQCVCICVWGVAEAKAALAAEAATEAAAAVATVAYATHTHLCTLSQRWTRTQLHTSAAHMQRHFMYRLVTCALSRSLALRCLRLRLAASPSLTACLCTVHGHNMHARLCMQHSGEWGMGNGGRTEVARLPAGWQGRLSTHAFGLLPGTHNYRLLRLLVAATAAAATATATSAAAAASRFVRFLLIGLAHWGNCDLYSRIGAYLQNKKKIS